MRSASTFSDRMGDRMFRSCSSLLAIQPVDRRRRSALNEQFDDNVSLASSGAASTSLSCPKPKKGFFYSRAYREHRKRKQRIKKNGHSRDAANTNSGHSRNTDDEIPLKRDLTRRRRNSFNRNPINSTCAHNTHNASHHRQHRGNFDSTNVAAYLAARVEADRLPQADLGEYNHAAAVGHAFVGGGGSRGSSSSGNPVKRSSSNTTTTNNSNNNSNNNCNNSSNCKSHMMDVALVGRDSIQVLASRFILACYSPTLEEVFFKQRTCHNYDAAAGTLTIDFCDRAVIRAAVHHCFTGEIPRDFDTVSPDERVARNLAQLDHLAHRYKFSALGEVTYRALRKLINRRAVLACAIFDELSYSREDGGGAAATAMGSCSAVDSIKRYALDSMREMPMDTLLGGGVQWMKEVSVEAIMQDQDMDVDEFYMFKVLKAWAAEDSFGCRLRVAQRLSDHIELKFIDTELLVTQVQDSGYFAQQQIAEAVRRIQDSLANRDPHEMERVLVERAGTDLVNGIYCRVINEIGMSEGEILFVKEDDDGCSDMGLYLWGSRWHIAMCADYSNCLYSCKDPPDRSTAAELVPGDKWAVQYGGLDPPPVCTYLPNTRMGRCSMQSGRRSSVSSQRSLLAPNLEEMMDPTIAEKRRSKYFDKRTEDVVQKRTMTLEQMMNLPEDRE